MTGGFTADRADRNTSLAAEYWLDIGGSELAAKVQSIAVSAAQELGQRTGLIPLVEPLFMAVLIILSPQLFEHWRALIVLQLVLIVSSVRRVMLGKRLVGVEAMHAVALTRGYQISMVIACFTWGSLVGLMVLFQGLDPVVELALLASIGLTVHALATLSFEQLLLRRFILALWLPLVTLTAAAAISGIERGWVLFAIELVCGGYAMFIGRRIVRDHILGLQSRQDLETATQTIDSQRDELHGHRNNVEELTTHAHQLVHYDPLTGIGNRAHFVERLATSIQAGRASDHAMFVLYLDLDGFKDINDSLGHQAGDTLLKAVAHRVRTLLCRSDFAARLGNDEFALLIDNVGHEQDASNIMALCLDRIQQPVDLGGTLVHPSASIGAAVYPLDGANTHTLLKAAESAMNAAKHGSSLRYVHHTPEMTLAARRRLTVEQELRVALAEGQFLLQYQPQIDTMSGTTCGVEALVRWQHPQRGLIPPSEFIPLAEKSHLIDSLGDWILRTACQQAADWFSRGVPRFSLAVNISPLQLRDPGFVDKVRSALELSGLEIELLELEITETALQTHAEAREALSRLSALGLRIAIDDFGIGYSSIASLKELPIDRVKIDRLFVSSMLSSERDTTLLGKIIEMAHFLGCDVVAEGVERKAHCDKLQALGCDCLQGYYFSMPVGASEIPALVGQNGPRRIRVAGGQGRDAPTATGGRNDDQGPRLNKRYGD